MQRADHGTETTKPRAEDLKPKNENNGHSYQLMTAASLICGIEFRFQVSGLRFFGVL